ERTRDRVDGTCVAKGVLHAQSIDSPHVADADHLNGVTAVLVAHAAAAPMRFQEGRDYVLADVSDEDLVAFAAVGWHARPLLDRRHEFLPERATNSVPRQPGFLGEIVDRVHRRISLRCFSVSVNT